jgi:uncharacterized surface protein with fasciclin (FAS1) repeats
MVLLSFAAVFPLLGTGPARAESEPKDIVDTAVSAGNFDTLVAAVKAAGLAETLKQPGPFTVFAPTDDAFKQLPPKTLKSLLKPTKKDQLGAVLTYHVVPGRVTAREAFGLDNASTVNGQRLDISRQDGRLVIGGATVVATDVNCTNGVIHVIDQVLLPESKRIPAVAKKAGQFNTLLTAVSAAGLGKVLDGAGPFTVFAPTDDAFEALPKGTVETLLKPENKEKLVDILKYHVVSGRVYSDEAAQAGQAATLLGNVVETSVTADGLRINDSLVVNGDLETANGVIHVIDAVLLPQPMGALQARRTIEDAIRRGVPVFNRGDHAQCAEIYTTACQAIVSSASDEVPQSAIKALKTGLDRAKDLKDGRSRAWALRGGMDTAWAALREELPASSGTAEAQERFLFTFEEPVAAAQWRTTNDGVMGGRSDGRFKINDNNNLEFFGTLSLANNGGFASVRSSGSNLGLRKGDSIVARVRGDGRKYTLNLYTPSRRIAFSYRAEFETKKDEWVEVRVPVEDFVATSFGRVIGNQGPDPSQVNGLGILLGDKKAGPFKLEVEWIKAVKTSR